MGIKRSSPLAPHQQPPRPSKLAHYEPPTTQQQHAHAHLYANGQVLPPPPAHDATTPSPTPSSSSSSCGRRSNSNNGKLLVDPPLLMSPEINSLLGDERPLQLSHHQQQQQQMLHHHQSQQQQHLQLTQQQLRVAHLGHGLSHGHSTMPTLGGQRNGNGNAADDGKLYVDQAKNSTRVSVPKYAPQQAPPPAHVAFPLEPHILHQHKYQRLATQTVAEDLTMKRKEQESDSELEPEVVAAFVEDGGSHSGSSSSSSSSHSGSDSSSDVPWIAFKTLYTYTHTHTSEHNYTFIHFVNTTCTKNDLFSHLVHFNCCLFYLVCFLPVTLVVLNVIVACFCFSRFAFFLFCYDFY